MSVKGEKYKSKAAEKKHEKSEGAKERKKEYGSAQKGMGFAAAQKQIQKKSHVSKKSAGAILAAGARKASKAAVKANPNLKKVRGMSKRGK